MKPKVIMVNTTGGNGSTIGEHISILSKGLGCRGFEVLTAVGRGKGNLVLGGEGRHFFNALKGRLTDGDGFLDQRATQKLCAWIRSEKPDIVHLHNLHGYYANMPMIVECLRELGCAVVVTLHDNWMLTGHCANIPADCDSFENGCSKCTHFSDYPASIYKGDCGRRRLFKARLLQSLPNIKLIAPTPKMAKLAAASDIGNIRTQTVAHGIDDIFFQHKKDGLNTPDTDNLRLLAVSRQWGGIKGFRHLIKLAEQMPEGWTLSIVGDCKKIPGLHNIKYLGHIQCKKELACLYKEHDVFINPSENESFGLVVAEALACGTPAVVNSLSACSDLLTKNDGISIEFDDISAVIAAIKETAKLHPQSRYLQSEMVDAYAAIYKGMIQS